MAVDPWLPIGYLLPNGHTISMILKAGNHWQIYEVYDGSKALIVDPFLYSDWLESGLLEDGYFSAMKFGLIDFMVLLSLPSQIMAPVDDHSVCRSKSQALSFALAIRNTRKILPECSLKECLYIEKLSLLLPTNKNISSIGDDLVLGFWISGGINRSIFELFDYMRASMNISHSELLEIAAEAKLDRENSSVEVNAHSLKPMDNTITENIIKATNKLTHKDKFKLSGRPAIESFLNEQIDILRHPKRYATLGISFPPPFILQGPPGCGKTYAVEKLIEYLEWPSYSIDASSIASPYIHETSRKIAEIFDLAIKSSPSIVIIDEMDAFLSDREMGSGHHRVEEVAEFLRQIPLAIKNNVLIVAMTNRIDLIDPAILRRGRFDHILSVDFATQIELRDMLTDMTRHLPLADDVNINAIAQKLTGRPLSDASYIIRESARITAHDGRDKINHDTLLIALSKSAPRGRREEPCLIPGEYKDS